VIAKRIIRIVLIAIAVLVIVVFGINAIVAFSTKSRIVSREQAGELNDVDCILVLGAGVWGNHPTPMLADRLDESILLYNEKVCDTIVMSGDHGSDDYNEVGSMKRYAVNAGIPSEDVFMDHAGFSTYDSMYRIKEIFGAKKIIIVTQKYHMYRALYIARALGIEAYGVTSDPRSYAGAEYRELREVLARDKDFFKCIFKPLPKLMGDKISLDDSGDVTNDSAYEAEGV